MLFFAILGLFVLLGFPFPSRSASAVSISRVGWFVPPFQHLQMLLFIFFLPFLSFSVFIRPNPRPWSASFNPTLENLICCCASTFSTFGCFCFSSRYRHAFDRRIPIPPPHTMITFYVWGCHIFLWASGNWWMPVCGFSAVECINLLAFAAFPFYASVVLGHWVLKDGIQWTLWHISWMIHLWILAIFSYCCWISHTCV